MINQPYSSFLCSGEQRKYFHDSVWIQEKESIIYRSQEWSFMRKYTSTSQTCWICAWGYPIKSLEATFSLSDSAVCDSPKHTECSASASFLCICQMFLQTLQDINKSYINQKLVSCAALLWIVLSPSNSFDKDFFSYLRDWKACEYI